MNVRVAAQPIAWSNDDFRDLGADIPLERCLSEMREAGYEGTELGHKFPRRAPALRRVLGRYGLELASAWHSARLLSRSFASERAALRGHLRLLKALGCRVAVVAECTGRSYADGGPIRWSGEDNGLSPAEWAALCLRLDALADLAAEAGLRLAYHPHLGTAIQREDEVDRLLRGTRRLGLVADTGHLACAGADARRVVKAWTRRIAHVHLKDVRPSVLARAKRGRRTFEEAVRAGLFTVPGDGGLDFAAILRELDRARYRGWLVVEAEQDPARAEPLAYARRARRHLRELGV